MNCGCRAITSNIAKLLTEEGFDIPAPAERSAADVHNEQRPDRPSDTAQDSDGP